MCECVFIQTEPEPSQQVPPGTTRIKTQALAALFSPDGED